MSVSDISDLGPEAQSALDKAAAQTRRQLEEVAKKLAEQQK